MCSLLSMKFLIFVALVMSINSAAADLPKIGRPLQQASADQSITFKANGHSIQLGHYTPDKLGNWPDVAVNELSQVLEEILSKKISGQEYRAAHQSILIEIVKAREYSFSSESQRGFLRVPELSIYRMGIPSGENIDAVKSFIESKLASLPDKVMPCDFALTSRTAN
jgi:hypothetical protein